MNKPNSNCSIEETIEETINKQIIDASLEGCNCQKKKIS